MQLKIERSNLVLVGNFLIKFEIMKAILQYKKHILGLLLAALVIMQFFRIDKTNPAFEKENDFIAQLNPPAEVASLLKVACYDCHSYESAYPWYTNIAPLSFWIKGHINEGRGHLNFSEWATYKKSKADHKVDECIETIEEKSMPLKSYTITHGDARLSKEQRALLVDWLKQQL